LGFEPKQLITWVKGRLTNDVEQVEEDWEKVTLGWCEHWHGALHAELTEHMLLCTEGSAAS
jgi:hypothetical protein